MCDYSLHLVATTPAAIGDKLVTTRFPGTSTRGFCAAGEPNVAVCIPPGAELAFDEDVRYGVLFRWLGRPKSRVAVFRQINMHRPNEHHDALEFANGRIVLLTRLRPGQVATVLQLPPARKPEARTSPAQRKSEADLNPPSL